MNIRRQLREKERADLSMYSPVLAHLLFHRGFRDLDSAEKFLKPDYDRDTHNPFLLKDAERAAKRIIEAIKEDEKITIYADYDADGIPGAALFRDFLNRIGFKNFSVYIPHRHNEGFGLNEKAIKKISEDGTRLIITIDCGITDVKQVDLINRLGMEVIVTDHHESPEKEPKAFAIIDPKRRGCDYPDKNICGAGVIYKLIQAILKIDRFGLKDGHEKWFLDLLGIATLSDMVPLTGENRVFAKYGLDVIRKSFRLGLKKLFEHLRMSQKHITEDDIAFMITPRINAASRMGVPMDAFELLSSSDEEMARKAVEHLDHINNERKGIVAALVKEIKKLVRERYSEIPKVIVLGNPDWKPALLGLAANSCVEEFKRPVFLWGRDGDNMIKGSCRAFGDYHLVELMRAVAPDVLTQFGGHKHSGGFAVSEEEIHFLDRHLNEAMEKLSGIRLNLSENKATDNSDIFQSADDEYETPDDVDAIDLEVAMDEVNWNLFDDINTLAPFGIGNPKPVFISRNVSPKSVRSFGKNNEHIEISFMKSNGQRLNAISFFGSGNESAKSLINTRDWKPLNIVFSLEKSLFRGSPELRMRVIDIIL